jgi:hypothetical protein
LQVAGCCTYQFLSSRLLQHVETFGTAAVVGRSDMTAAS